MSITLLTVIPRHERRLRLLFTNTLASGAFTTPSLYTIANQDSAGISPDVAGLLVVSGSTNAVEIALDNDLVGGAQYLVSAVGVPAIDSSVNDDLQSLLYGIDLVWTGSDYAEDASGDLSTISGLSNATQAISRRLQSDGLPWDDSFGAKPREFVDGAPGEMVSLRGALTRQTLLDDRVKSVVVSIEQDPEDPADTVFDIDVTMIGAEGRTQLQIQVPTKN